MFEFPHPILSFLLFVQEKEKELEVQNIYSQRINLKRKVIKSQQPSLDSSSQGTADSPRVAKSVTPRTRFLDLREDAKISSKISDGVVIDDRAEMNQSADVETMVSALRRKEEELERMLGEEHKRKQFEEDKQKLREMEERIRAKQNEIDDAGQRKKEAVMRSDEQRHEEEQRKMRDKEREERRAIEQLSRQKDEQRLIIEKLELEQKEEENRKAESRSVEQGDLMRRLTKHNRKKELEGNNFVDEDAQRKKELLLARMKAIDDGKDVKEVKDDTIRSKILLPGGQSTFSSKGQTTFSTGGQSSVQASKPIGVTSTSAQKKKPIFLENGPPDNDNEVVLRHGPLDFSSKTDRANKEYTFKVTDSNLHQGLPSHTDLVIAKSNVKQSDDVAFGAYTPTVNSGGKKRTSRFQNDKKGEKKDEDFLFFDTAKAKTGDSATKGEQPEKENFPFFSTKEAKEAVSRKAVEADNLMFDISKDNKKKSDLSRNNTRSISDDDSQMFTIGGKEPDKSKTAGIVRGRTRSKNSTPGSGKRVFGSYEPTFANSGSANSNEVASPDSDPFAEDGAKHGRRRGQQKNSGALGDSLFTVDKDTEKPGLNGDFRGTVGSSGQKPGIFGTAVKAVSGFVDDDIEEMVLT